MKVLILILIFIFKLSFQNLLKIPFRTENPILKYFDVPIENREIVYFQIGEPEKKTPLIIKFNHYYYFISGSQIKNSTYNESNSNTYKRLSNELSEINPSFHIKGYKSEEKFKFPTNKNNLVTVNNFFFYLSSESEIEDNYLGFLGLQIKPHKQSKDDNNFITLLKKNNIIKNYIWSIKYENENNGFLLIGDYPHNFDNLNYNKNQLKNTKTETLSNANMWEIKFDKIFYNNNELKIKTKAILRIENGIILGPKDFKKIFYDTYVNNKTCEQYEVNMESEDNVYGFKCYINKFKKEYFKPLTFLHKELNFNYSLNGDDLFIKHEDFYYFLIIFETTPTQNYDWVFGKPFLKKYQFVFDSDGKKIEFYNTNIKIEKENSIFAIFLIIFLFIILACLIYMLSLFLRKKRKSRVNEIDEIYEYIPTNN